MTTRIKHTKKVYSKRLETMDIVLLILLTVWLLVILVPFINVIAISFSEYKEYLARPTMLFPLEPTLKNYSDLIEDGRIWIGYRTTLSIEALGLPISLFLTTSMGYALSRKFPGKKLFILFVLITMVFQGGIVPTYLVVKELGLTNTIWSVILTTAINTFYMILAMNYFAGLPDSLMESARLDGAGEWNILWSIVLPLSMPILATITLFYAVDKWNEWYFAKIFIRKNNLQTLQLVLRSMVIDASIATQATAEIKDKTFSSGLKMAAVVATMLPIMLVFPFLQKHFAKGVVVGAIKA